MMLKRKNCAYWANVNSTKRNPKINVHKVRDLLTGLNDPKTGNEVKVIKSLFRDFLLSSNQIGHEEPINRDPGFRGSTHKAQEEFYFIKKVLEPQG